MNQLLPNYEQWNHEQSIVEKSMVADDAATKLLSEHLRNGTITEADIIE